MIKEANRGSGIVAEKCDKCGLLKAGDLHQFSVCALEKFDEFKAAIKDQAAMADEVVKQFHAYRRSAGESDWINLKKAIAEIEGAKS